jgi:Uma2 family endonuclease
MSTIVSPPGSKAVTYPESDGLPMSDNTKQFRWIVTIQGGLDALYRMDADVFVAGNLLWYPVEGNNTIRTTPDIFVAFGRPKGDRGSYLQWREGNIAPHVTFEVLSPGNRAGNLTNKFKFYERYGVEEYYLWDPDNVELSGWQRDGGELRAISEMNRWISRRLQVRFELIEGDLQLYGPDGKRFATYVELVEQREELARQREQERQAKDQAQGRAERLTAQLKALGIEPDA